MDADVQTNNLKLKLRIQITKKKTIGNRYELEIILEDTVYPKT